MSDTGFFDSYPDFYRPPVTELKKNRFNNRYTALIENNKKLILDSSVLDMACHDGTWSFAAIKNNAKYCLGIEGRPHLIDNAHRIFEKYEIPNEKYSFKIGDIHEEIKKLPANKFDLVFCFGFFYHTCHHLFLLSEIKRLNPKYLILDTTISPDSNPIISYNFDDPNNKLSAISDKSDQVQVLVGRPSKSGLEMFLKYFKFDYFYYDWHSMGINDWTGLEDYRDNKRVSLVAKNLTH